MNPEPAADKTLRVLVACEFSGVVRDAFAARGHDAWSCDLLPSESYHPVVFASELPLCECCGEEAYCPIHECHFSECSCIGPTEDGIAYKESDGVLLGSKHIQSDVLEVVGQGWDLMVAHPPCTHLAVSGAAHFAKKQADGRQRKAMDFFIKLAEAPIHRICIENPVGIMSSRWRKPTQIIQPFYFGDEFQKTTCLWLKNLPPLMHCDDDDWFFKKTHVGKGEMVRFASGRTMPKWYADAWGDGKSRSKTFQGIANAMAEQWGNLP